MADILAKRIEERKIEALVEVVVPLEESQEMERLFVETDDEATPVKIQFPERFTSRSNLGFPVPTQQRGNKSWDGGKH